MKAERLGKKMAGKKESRKVDSWEQWKVELMGKYSVEQMVGNWVARWG